MYDGKIKGFSLETQQVPIKKLLQSKNANADFADHLSAKRDALNQIETPKSSRNHCQLPMQKLDEISFALP